MGPRSASAEPKEDPKLKFSPSQLKEMERYGVSLDLQRQINESIEKTKTFLIQNFKAGNKSWRHLFNKQIDSPAGQHALGILALLSTNIKPEDPIIDDLFACKDFDDINKSFLTYTHTLRGLASASYIRALNEEYHESPDKLPKSSKITLEKAKSVLKKSVRFVIKNFNEELNGWRYPEDRVSPEYSRDGVLADMSNTQYCIFSCFEKPINFQIAREREKR